MLRTLHILDTDAGRALTRAQTEL